MGGMFPSAASAPGAANNLLNFLRAEDAALLAPHLKPFSSKPNAVLYHHGDHVGTVYFPCGATLVSFLISMEDGGTVETTMVGREGAVGGIVSQGKLPAFSQIMVQFGGEFLAMPVEALDAAKAKSRSLDNLFSRYADCLMAQMFQSTACNAAHGIEQRAAKWIIAAVDRTGELEVPLTQERLASMLGVGRSYISRIIQRMKRDGILSVRRGKLKIHDPKQLAARSCGCNDAVKAHFELILQGIYPADTDGCQTPLRASSGT